MTDQLHLPAINPHHRLTLQDHLAWLDEGAVLVNIGQLEDRCARQLDRLVKRGYLVKWRGRWYPVAGAQFGIGPLKTCWATPAVASYIRSLAARRVRPDTEPVLARVPRV